MKATEFRAELLDLVGRAWPLNYDGDDDPYAVPDDDETPDAGVPTAVLLVMEWQGSDGQRWMSRVGALGSGASAPRWTVEMLAREALHWDDR